MRRIILLPLASVLACYSPMKEDLTNDTTTMSTGGEESSSTSGATLTTTDTSITSAEVTSTSAEESASESESESTVTTTTSVDESSSSSGDVPAVCGDAIHDPDTEDCDDGNRDVGDLCDADCHFESLTFVYTGASEMFEVPAWVDTLRIEAFGAQGGGALCCDETIQDDGGLGGYAAGTLPTLAGVTLSINVGGVGASGGAGGWNGGGAGGMYGAGGGGGSDVRIGDMLFGRILVAGGGGGGNCGCPDHGTGGAGGGLDGDPGISNQGLPAPGGGTQNEGGAPGDNATPGTLGIGGTAVSDAYHVAGGGGGYYGGGGGFATGAGGGSSYYGTAVDPETTAAVQPGDGQIIITPVASL